MLGWIAQQVIISLVLILLFHHILVFVTQTFTKPKIIDLVNKPTETYEDIYKTIHKDEELIPPPNVSTGLPENIKQSMQLELQEYLNTITENTVPENTVHKNTVPENTVHKNTVHENTVHENTVHENTVHENTNK